MGPTEMELVAPPVTVVGDAYASGGSGGHVQVSELAAWPGGWGARDGVCVC
jgi:hypothetical protein